MTMNNLSLRHMRRKYRKRSDTSGKQKRQDTCQKRKVAGMSRSYWISAKSYKDRRYHEWCKFCDGVN